MNHSSFDSIYLTSADILSSPLFSRNAWQLHLDYLRQYGDQPTNDARDRETFKVLGRTQVFQNLIQICRKIHVVYGTTLPDILEDLSRPLNQINDPTISPQVTFDRLKLVLSELRQFEKQANTLLGELSDVCYSNNVPNESLNIFLSSIERPIMSAIIKYWSNSCKEKIAVLEESLDPRNSHKFETISPVTPPKLSNLVPTFSSSPILPLGLLPPMNSPPKRLGIDLAKAKVPRFTGRKDEFPMFFALLNEVLDYNRDYPETTRIGFLVSNLGGEPLTSIQSIPIRAGSLAIMLKSLQDRYGDSEDQVDRLIKILKDKRLSVPRTHQELTSWYYQLRDMSVCLLSSTSEAQERLFLSCLFDSLPFNIHESIVASFDRSGQKATGQECHQ
ncbi:unnamed protein product [Bursaphelenchus xylophilus]|uniref:(pine wood nematode) hypothetical protein n=1 Tax=Bursaphelenchus xylophilus TaxID=6326 RepID=A0A7I8WN77_BURXY|nr:unnamed protein product [Bursaphelenchus xylophilus]CAG9092692.1 unnamed protein product [Bursaphelenchus xylophilus]